MKLNFLLSLLLLFVATSASAYDFEVDGIYYNINGNEATVTYQGNWYPSDIEKYKGDVMIPESVTYNGVTRAVTAIGQNAFWNCHDLTSVMIGNRVTSIGGMAFAGCDKLTSVIIPNSVITIEREAFAGCIGLANLTIGNSVATIDSYAFTGCSALTSVAFPNSVTRIDIDAFRDCKALASVTIPNSVTHIGMNPFNGCSGLTSITVESGNPKYDSRENCNAIIETARNTLIVGCKNTLIPNSITSIGGYAYIGCSGLMSLTIPNSVTSIGNNAFVGCNGLTNLTRLVMQTKPWHVWQTT